MHSVVWKPTDDIWEKTRLGQWIRALGFRDYESFYMRSIEDIAWFWQEVERALHIRWRFPYEKVLNLTDGPAWPRWFEGGRLNLIDSAIGQWLTQSDTRKRLAILWEGENGDQRQLTYEELSSYVQRVATGFAKLGVEPGDRIALYLPMIPETVVAFLAVAYVGAIAVPMFSGYGKEAIATRLQSSRARFFITADGFFRRGKTIRMKEQADAALTITKHAVEKMIVVPYLNLDVPWDDERDVNWQDWVKFHEKRPHHDLGEPRTMYSDDPFMIIYTSGTTGRPKGAVHTHAGFPIKAASDAAFGMDIREKDRLFWITDMGWMMGPFVVFAALMNGATMFLYDGVVDYPEPKRIVTLLQEHAITHWGMSPTLIRSLMVHAELNDGSISLPQLRVLASTGEPWDPKSWEWLFERIGKRKTPIFNYSGGTEISGGILGNVLLKPISVAGFNSPLPGMAAEVWNEKGEHVEDTVGELIIKKPWVGQTKGFWEEAKRYEETYWSRWPGVWVHGDWVKKDKEGFFYILGRSDDTLNIAGKRIGPGEIESVLTLHPSVKEAAVIGVPHEVKGEVAVCFVVLHSDDIQQKDSRLSLHSDPSTSMLEQDLKDWVGERLGKSLTPYAVYLVPELPKTRNGKIMRRILRSVYLGQDTGDVSSIDNAHALRYLPSLKGK